MRIYEKLKLACFIFSLLFTAFRAHALPVISWEAGSSEFSLGRDIEIYFDQDAQKNIDDIIHSNFDGFWKKSSSIAPNLGYKKGNLWARFQIRQESKIPEPLILEYSYPQVDVLEVYYLNEDKLQIMRAGDHVPREQWSRDLRLPSFILKESKFSTVYVKVAGNASKQLPLTLWGQKKFEEVREQRDVIQALYFGALFAILAYNFLVGIGTGLKVYYYYVGFLFFYAIFTGAMTGYGYSLVWNIPGAIPDLALYAGIVGIGMMSNSFAIKLLGLERTLRFSRWMHNLFLVWLILVPSLYFTIGFGGLQQIAIVGLIIPWVSSLVLYGIIAHLKKVEVARWYGLAWSMLIVGSLATTLKQAGIWPPNAFTTYAQQIGSVVEFILLSFALAQRIKTLQKEVELRQEQTLYAEKRARQADAKALAEQLLINEQRDQLVANTSHELRTPLNGMMGLIQAILIRDGEKISPESKKSIQGIITSSKRLATLIGDLLDFSRGQRGDIPLYRGKLDVREQIEEVVLLMNPIIASRPVELRLSLAQGLSGVFADPDRFQQILFNLIGNASKFTEKGFIEISAREVGDTILIAIEDTGPGIPEESQARIFEAFAQADGGIARRYGGTGLGLAIVKQLVEAHQGKIGLQSIPGRGSTFWFQLPKANGEDESQVSVKSDILKDRSLTLLNQLAAAGGLETVDTTNISPKAQPLKASKLQIWVADDEPINRQVLEELLSLAGHDVQIFPDGVQVLEAIAKGHNPDLLLLDVMMPKISGFDVLRQLRSQFNEAELPILLLTAKALEKDLVEGFSLGASDYILKPFVATEVQARIEHQARLKQAIWQSQNALEEIARLRQQLQNAEEQMLHTERLASVGAATGGIIHDLANPLQHIDTTVSWARKRQKKIYSSQELPEVLRPDLEAAEEALDLAAQSTKTAMDITQGLKVLIRSDAGVEEYFLFTDLLEYVTAILHFKLKQLEFTLNKENGLMIRGKRSEWIQLLMNLLGNAADALENCPKKKIALTLASQGEGMLLSIEDSGPGIPEKLRKLVFEPFYTTKPSGKGTGLGLAVVQTVVRHQGGSIQLDQSPSLGGARFLIYIPHAIQAEAELQRGAAITA